MTNDEFEIVEQLFASLPDRESRDAALRIMAREAAQMQHDCLNSGKLIGEEKPQKNKRRPMDDLVI